MSSKPEPLPGAEYWEVDLTPYAFVPGKGWFSGAGSGWLELPDMPAEVEFFGDRISEQEFKELVERDVHEEEPYPHPMDWNPGTWVEAALWNWRNRRIRKKKDKQGA